ncbi:MAG: hypothetical protein ACPGUC_04605 [Gammaproteobacteria bacterium]
MSMRLSLASGLLLLAIALPVSHAFVQPLPPWLLGLPAWLAGVLLWTRATRQALVQSSALLLVGLGGLAWGAYHGVDLRWDLVLAGNAMIVAMLAAVSFLKLVVRAGGEGRPRHRRSIVETALGLHLFGAIINMSMVYIVAQRLTRGGSLDDRQTMIITRCFTAAAFWSPFFAAMGVALTWSPGADLGVLVTAGLPLAMAALFFTMVETVRHSPEPFEGYPLNPGGLALPLILALLVMEIHDRLPDVPVIAIICLLVPPISMLGAWLRRDGGREELRQHLGEGLPNMANELTLFLSAGIMAAGTAALFASFGDWLPFERFTPTEASILLGVMLLVSMVGVHPVIAISVAGTLLLPLAPDPDLLATTFLCTWAIGTGISPFSGINLSLQGRFGLRAGQVLRLNWHYGLGMYLLAALVLHVAHG